MIRIDILVRIKGTSDTTILTHYGPGTIKDYNIQIIIKAKEIIDNEGYMYISHITKEINRGGPGRGQGRKPKPLKERKARLTFTLSRSIAAWLELMAKKGYVKSQLVEKALRKLKGGNHEDKK